MTSKSPAFQWYPKDILASARVQMMSMTEECAYRRLIDYCWINGFVPADPQKAARLVGKGCSVETAKVALEMFEPHPEDAEKMIHDRLEIERAKQESNSKARQKAAAARWNEQGKSVNGNGKQVESKADANALQTDMQTDALHISSSSSKPSSFSNEKKDGGGNAPARVKEKPPPPEVSSDFPKDKRQWMELTETEKNMDLEQFLVHLQIRFEKKNVRAVAKKLKDFCDKRDIAFQFERLKGWVYNEGKAITEEEFLAAIGDENSERKAAKENCPFKCDSRGLIKTEKGMQKCNHGKK